MTNREAYVFGWVFGRLNAAAYPQEIGGDLTLAAQRPYTALARVISDAHRLGLLKRDLDRQVAEALCEITSIDPPVEGGSEKFQPLISIHAPREGCDRERARSVGGGGGHL